MDEIDILNQSRQAAIARETLSSFVVVKREQLLGALVTKYRIGQHDYVGEVAQLTFLTDLENDLKRKIQKGEKLYGQKDINQR